jgi:hypothetical protein
METFFIQDDINFFDMEPKKPRKDISEIKKKELLPIPKIRSEEELQQLFPRYPTEDGYMKSYLPDQDKEYIPMLEKYGFVVIKVFDSDICEETIKELFEDMNKYASKRQVKKLSREDPTSWEQCNWPSKGKY